MKRPILAILSAASLVSACATLPSPRTCENALTGLTAAQEIVAVLQSHGYAADIAAKVAQALSLGQIGVGVACGGR